MLLLLVFFCLIYLFSLSFTLLSEDGKTEAEGEEQNNKTDRMRTKKGGWMKKVKEYKV